MSECHLIMKDLWQAGYSRVWMNPGVSVRLCRHCRAQPRAADLFDGAGHVRQALTLAAALGDGTAESAPPTLGASRGATSGTPACD